MSPKLPLTPEFHTSPKNDKGEYAVGFSIIGESNRLSAVIFGTPAELKDKVHEAVNLGACVEAHEMASREIAKAYSKRNQAVKNMDIDQMLSSLEN